MARPAIWLRMEGAVSLAASLLIYHEVGGGWILFAALLLAPDLSMLGYLGGSRRGAFLYNVFHSYVLPVSIGIAAWSVGLEPAIPPVLVWTAHIGMDRMLGYGLKLDLGFRETHLGRIGPAPSTRPFNATAP